MLLWMGLFYFFFRYFLVGVYEWNWFLYADFASCNFTEFINNSNNSFFIFAGVFRISYI